jgi:chaperonin cofactor prefoldin
MRNEITAKALEDQPAGDKCYTTVGKMFFRKDPEVIKQEFAADLQKDAKEIKRLADKKEYLERQLKSCEENIKGIVGDGEEDKAGEAMTTL